MKAYTRGRGIVPIILNLGTNLILMATYTFRSPNKREGMPVPSEMEGSRAPGTTWTFNVTEKYLSLPGFETQTLQPVI